MSEKLKRIWYNVLILTTTFGIMMKKKDIDEKLMLYLDRGLDLDKRRIWLEGVVDSDICGALIRCIQYFNTVSETEPITLYINSEGGIITDGLALVDTIKQSKAPINTMTIGTAYSMALIIFLAGKERITLPSARFMNHSASSSIEGKKESMKNTLKNIEEVDDLCQSVFKNTKKTIKWWSERTKSEDFYFGAKEALKLGVVTKILGEEE